VQQVKLRAGHLVLYPATSLHHVTPVTRGARVSSFFWIQSMVRDNTRRAMLFDLDMAIQRLTHEVPDNNTVQSTAVQLTGLYNNLLRQWAEMG
jgi:PKHD-type hydroxylase